MCGRVAQTTTIERVIELTEIAGKLDMTPHYNIAPSMELIGIVATPSGDKHWQKFRWGLIPHWAKDPKIGFKTFNAKADTLAQKPAFRDAYRKRRCVIPVDGFYEWQRLGTMKKPYFIHNTDGMPLMLAGLWESWNDGTGQLFSCTIITTNANSLLSEIHHRMPVILDLSDIDLWLGPEVNPQVASLLRPLQGGSLEKFPVTNKMNNARYIEPDCMAPLSD